MFYNAGVVEAVNNDYASGVFQTVAGFEYTWLTSPITASIVAGLPIAVILLFMIYDMVKSLHDEYPLLDVEDKFELEFLNR